MIHSGENFLDGNWKAGVGNLLMAGVDYLTLGSGTFFKKGVKEGVELLSKEAIEGKVGKYLTSSGGRYGNSATRNQLNEIATKLEAKGWKVTNGAGRDKEFYFKPLEKGRKGGSYTDLTATRNGKTIHINTIDTYKKIGKGTTRELNNASRIRSQIGDDPSTKLLLIKKKIH